MTKPSISLVGAGSLATALALWLHGAGYRVDEIIARPTSLRRARGLARRVGARSVTSEQAGFRAVIVWLCVPDDAIAACASALADRAEWQGKIVLHSSGALPSSVLAPLRDQGAAVASVHPMMTFVRGAVAPAADGIPFAIEGEAKAAAAAKTIVRALRGEILAIGAENKPLYHALGAFASPLIVAQLAIAETVAGAAGIPPRQVRRAIAPILRRTLENYVAHGAAAAFSGPLARGDLGTVQKHLQALRRVPEARCAYLALARAAARALPVGNRKAMRRLLEK